LIAKVFLFPDIMGGLLHAADRYVISERRLDLVRSLFATSARCSVAPANTHVTNPLGLKTFRFLARKLSTFAADYHLQQLQWRSTGTDEQNGRTWGVCGW